MSEIIGVIGAGTMGNGIAQTAAGAGFDVVICDVSAELVERGLANIGKSLDRSHHGGRPRTTIKVVGKLSGSPEDAWARLMAAVKPIGTIVFEQAPTNLEVNIPELGDAYLAHTVACSGADNYVYTMLSVYGKTPTEVETIREKWQPWLEQVLGVEAPSRV